MTLVDLQAMAAKQQLESRMHFFYLINLLGIFFFLTKWPQWAFPIKKNCTLISQSLNVCVKKHSIALFDEVSNTETRSQVQLCILLSLPNYGIFNGQCSQNKTVTTLLHVRVLMLSSKWWLFVLHVDHMGHSCLCGLGKENLKCRPDVLYTVLYAWFWETILTLDHFTSPLIFKLVLQCKTFEEAFDPYLYLHGLHVEVTGWFKCFGTSGQPVCGNGSEGTHAHEGVGG